MERLLAHHEFVGVRRRGPLPLQVHIASIIHVAAKARMRFQPASIRQVDRTRSDIIDRGAAIMVDRKPVKSNPSMPPQSQSVFLRRSRAVMKRLLQASARIGRSQLGLLRAPPAPAMASVHSSACYSRLPPVLRQRCPRPQSARRMKRVFGRRENARRKKRGGSLMRVAPTLRLQVRKQTSSPSSPRARATHGDRDSSGGSFQKLKRVQTRPAVQHLPRQLHAGPPTPAQIQESALRCQGRSSAPRYEPRFPRSQPGAAASYKSTLPGRIPRFPAADDRTIAARIV